ncbi:hypothetical protein E4U45_005602 [Claviceps purpurea]|nr:hypothetical protein E4U45_005602 [Claviceps purpurea]
MAHNGTADLATKNELIPGDTADLVVNEVPPLPPSELYDSFDDLFNFLQAWAQSNGVYFVKKSSSNPRVINGKKIAAHRLVLCDRGPGRPSTGRGLRRIPSQKAGCPVRITASVTMRNNWRWSYRVSGAHNHPPSHHLSQHAVNRRRTAEQRVLALELSLELSQQRALPAREGAVALRERSGERERDICNDLQRNRSFASQQDSTTVAHSGQPPDAIATAGPASPSSAAEDEDVPGHTADTEVSEVDENNEVQEVPPLPPSELYDSFDDLFNFLQAWACSNGVAFIKKSASNFREINGTKIATHRLLLCDRGSGRPSTGRGLRQTPSQKADCPIRITASVTMKNNLRWSYRVSGAHNHPPSHHPSQHAVHRRRTAEQRMLALELSQQRALPAREVAVALRERSGEPAFFRERDIYNDLKRFRSLASPRNSTTAVHDQQSSDAIATAGPTSPSAAKDEDVPGHTADTEVSEVDEDNEVQEIPPLPPSLLYDTFDDLFNFLQGWARSNGVTFVKKGSSNTREINGTKMATRRLVLCDRGPGRPSTSRLHPRFRKPTRKIDCPFRISISATLKNNWRWSYRVSGAHNHPRSHDPSENSTHRRRAAGQRSLASKPAQRPTLPACEVAVALRERSGEPGFFRERDIYNDAQRVRSFASPQDTTTAAHNEQTSAAIATAGLASPSAAEYEGPPGRSSDLEAKEVLSSSAAEGEDVPGHTADTEVSGVDEVNAGNEDNKIQEVPPLPPSELYDSFDDLFNFLQGWARSNGVAFVKKSASNPREINGTKIAAHRLVLCDRGPGRPSRSRGLRLIPSQKADCPIRITASVTMKNNLRWSYRVSGAHNHPPSHHPSQHVVHRRRTAEQRVLALELSQQRALPAREVAVALRERSGEPAFFRARDIYNDLKRIRSLASSRNSTTAAHNGQPPDAIATADPVLPSSAAENEGPLGHSADLESKEAPSSSAAEGEDVPGHTADTEVNEVDEDIEVQEVPPLPPSELYDSFDDLFNFLQGWARSNGVAFVKKSASNPREINGTKIAAHRLLLCDRGPGRPSRSRGLRRIPSQKADCPIRITASVTMKNNLRWSYRVSGAHNHPPSHHPSQHVVHRRRTAEQRVLALELSRQRALPAREVAVALRERSGEPAFFRERDIYNDLKRFRSLASPRNSTTAVHDQQPSDAIATADPASPSSVTEDKDVPGHTADTEVSEVDEDNEVQEIPPLPPSVLYDTFDDLFAFLQTWARSNGVVFVKKSSSNTREINGTKMATRRLVLCDRGPGRPSTSRLHPRFRKPTLKIDCPFRIITSATMKNNWRWSYRVYGAHNHPRSHDPSENSMHRHRTAGQRSLASKPAQRPTLPARELAVAPKNRSVTPAFFRHRDVYNGRHRLPRSRKFET